LHVGAIPAVTANTSPRLRRKPLEYCGICHSAETRDAVFVFDKLPDRVGLVLLTLTE
jgi:hypothetical protein